MAEPVLAPTQPVDPAIPARRLQVNGLVKAYGGHRVVDGVKLDISQGEVVGLLGPNGAGKTTSFYMVVGLVRPEAGEIRVGGADITREPMYVRARRHGISYLPQESSVFRRLTVEENLMAILEGLRLTREERRRRCQVLLSDLGLTHLARNRAYTLSGGERRRVEIARALTTNPSFLLLDEPFTGIDPIAIADIQQLVGELKQRGIGVLVTDHNVRETLRITDRAYIIADGKIFRAGAPRELEQDPQVRKVYLGESFSLN
ncbi:MAG: LPS export ABC transporter ATP-binding protein [Acidobacteria bacterium]|nr:LPS export ABC transporter ATP-binding protein [Acidobacteriota bacterium]